MEESNPRIPMSLGNEKDVVGVHAIEEKDVLHCNICMETPTNAIFTNCGHLFCWPCICQWLESDNRKPCPVCKTMILREDIVMMRSAQEMNEQHVHCCYICTEYPLDAVVTTCGYLFCWSCLYKWLQDNNKPCPGCKLMARSCSIIPVYGCQRGSSSNSSDDSTPPRPSVLVTCETYREATPSGGDFEVEEIDAREYNRALQARRLSRPMGRPSRATNGHLPIRQGPTLFLASLNGIPAFQY